MEHIKDPLLLIQKNLAHIVVTMGFLYSQLLLLLLLYYYFFYKYFIILTIIIITVTIFVVTVLIIIIGVIGCGGNIQLMW